MHLQHFFSAVFYVVKVNLRHFVAAFPPLKMKKDTRRHKTNESSLESSVAVLEKVESYLMETVHIIVIFL
jgi:hypothetical protein